MFSGKHLNKHLHIGKLMIRSLHDSMSHSQYPVYHYLDRHPTP